MGIDPEQLNFVFTVATGGRPVTLNAERKKGGHFRQNSETQAWKSAAGWELRRRRLDRCRFDRVEVRITPTYPERSGNAPDTGSLYPTEKAIVDGLVAAEIIPDDNGLHVARIISEAPRIVPGLEIPTMVVEVHAVPALTDAEYHGRWLLASSNVVPGLSLV